MNKLPNFLCVGAQKAGTTSLHDILKQHPDIYLPKKKEAHFFDIEDRFEKGVGWWLDAFFSTYSNEKIMGAMTPEYLYFEEAPGRIATCLGKHIKVIIVLRNPAARAYSHYLMTLRRGHESLSFEEAVKAEKNRLKNNDWFSKNHFSYISRSLYYEQVKRYLELFGKENVLLLSFEKDIISNIEVTQKQIEKFLGIKHFDIKVDLKSNPARAPRIKQLNNLLYKSGYIKSFLKIFIKSSKVKIKLAQVLDNLNQKKVTNSKLSKEYKDYLLKEYFLYDIKLLEELTGADYSYWLEMEQNNE